MFRQLFRKGCIISNWGPKDFTVKGESPMKVGDCRVFLLPKKCPL